MRIETLKKYRPLVAEANELKQRMEAIDGLHSPVISNNPVHTNETHGLDTIIIKRHKLFRQYLKKLKRCQDMLLEVEQFLDTVNDPEVRTLIRYKYLDGKTWEEAGREIKMDPSWCRRKVMHALGEDIRYYRQSDITKPKKPKKPNQ